MSLKRFRLSESERSELAEMFSYPIPPLPEAVRARLEEELLASGLLDFLQKALDDWKNSQRDVEPISYLDQPLHRGIRRRLEEEIREIEFRKALCRCLNSPRFQEPLIGMIRVPVPEKKNK